MNIFLKMRYFLMIFIYVDLKIKTWSKQKKNPSNNAISFSFFLLQTQVVYQLEMDVFLLNQIVRGKTLQHFCVALSSPPTPHPLKILSKENILHDKSYHIRLNQRTKHSYFIEKEKKKKRVAIVANYLRSVFWCVTCILTFLNHCRYL